MVSYLQKITATQILISPHNDVAHRNEYMASIDCEELKLLTSSINVCTYVMCKNLYFFILGEDFLINILKNDLEQ